MTVSQKKRNDARQTKNQSSSVFHMPIILWAISEKPNFVSFLWRYRVLKNFKVPYLLKREYRGV